MNLSTVEQTLVSENEQQKPWVSLEEAASLLGMGVSTLKRYAAARLIHPSCGKKMGVAGDFAEM